MIKVGKHGVLVDDLFAYGLISWCVWFAWVVASHGRYEPGDDIGYWIGVAGASTMLVLLGYSLRKRFGAFRVLGRVKLWLWAHMALGVIGPTLILIHSKFEARSLNAAVALYSMLIVAGSGVIGRFLYLHISRGLNGELISLVRLQRLTSAHQREAIKLLTVSPSVVEGLNRFQSSHTSERPGGIDSLIRVCWLPFYKWIVYTRLSRDLKMPLWRWCVTYNVESSFDKRFALGKRMLLRHMDGVASVARYTAYERLFSLWHVAHVPFVFMLIGSTLFHIYAVHAY